MDRGLPRCKAVTPRHTLFSLSQMEEGGEENRGRRRKKEEEEEEGGGGGGGGGGGEASKRSAATPPQSPDSLLKKRMENGGAWLWRKSTFFNNFLRKNCTKALLFLTNCKSPKPLPKIRQISSRQAYPLVQENLDVTHGNLQVVMALC